MLAGNGRMASQRALPLPAGLYTSTHPALQGSSGIRIACWAGAYPQLTQVGAGVCWQGRCSLEV